MNSEKCQLKNHQLSNSNGIEKRRTNRQKKVHGKKAAPVLKSNGRSNLVLQSCNISIPNSCSLSENKSQKACAKQKKSNTKSNCKKQSRIKSHPEPDKGSDSEFVIISEGTDDGELNLADINDLSSTLSVCENMPPLKEDFLSVTNNDNTNKNSDSSSASLNCMESRSAKVDLNCLNVLSECNECSDLVSRDISEDLNSNLEIEKINFLPTYSSASESNSLVCKLDNNLTSSCISDPESKVDQNSGECAKPCNENVNSMPVEFASVIEKFASANKHFESKFDLYINVLKLDCITNYPDLNHENVPDIVLDFHTFEAAYEYYKSKKSNTRTGEGFSVVDNESEVLSNNIKTDNGNVSFGLESCSGDNTDKCLLNKKNLHENAVTDVERTDKCLLNKKNLHENAVTDVERTDLNLLDFHKQTECMNSIKSSADEIKSSNNTQQVLLTAVNTKRKKHKDMLQPRKKKKIQKQQHLNIDNNKSNAEEINSKVLHSSESLGNMSADFMEALHLAPDQQVLTDELEASSHSEKKLETNSTCASEFSFKTARGKESLKSNEESYSVKKIKKSSSKIALKRNGQLLGMPNKCHLQKELNKEVSSNKEVDIRSSDCNKKFEESKTENNTEIIVQSEHIPSNISMTSTADSKENYKRTNHFEDEPNILSDILNYEYETDLENCNQNDKGSSRISDPDISIKVPASYAQLNKFNQPVNSVESFEHESNIEASIHECGFNDLKQAFAINIPNNERTIPFLSGVLNTQDGSRTSTTAENSTRDSDTSEEDDSDGDFEPSFKRIRSEKYNTSYDSSYDEDEGLCESSSSPYNDEKDAIGNNSESKISGEYLKDVKEVIDAIQNNCQHKSVNEAIDIAKQYIAVSLPDIKKYIFEKLFLNMVAYIKEQSDNIAYSTSHDVIVNTFTLMKEFSLYDTNLCTLVIKNYFELDFEDLFVELFKSCIDMNIPLKPEVFSPYAKYLRSSNAEIDELLNFLLYLKNVCCCNRLPVDMCCTVLDKCAAGNCDDVCAYRIFELLPGIDSQKVEIRYVKNFLQYCCKKEFWHQLSKTVIASHSKSNFLLHCLLQTFVDQIDVCGKYFEKFAAAFHGMQKPSFEHKSLLGQLGICLMLNAYSDNKLSPAVHILYVLHRYNLNYHELQMPVLSSHLNGKEIFNEEILKEDFFVFPYKIVFKAIDIFLRAGRPKDAYLVFEGYSWIKPDENLIPAFKSIINAERFSYLIKLVQALHLVDPLDKGWNVLQIISASVKDFSSEELSHYIKALELAYNQYMITLLNEKEVNRAYELFQYVCGQLRSILSVKSDIIRGLIVSLAENNMRQEAKDLFILNVTMYSLEKPQISSFPWCVTVMSNWTSHEIFFAIQYYFEALFPVLANKDKAVEFEKWFSVTFKFKEAPDSPTINCLKIPSMHFDSLAKKLRAVLKSFNSKLEIIEDKFKKCLRIKPRTVYNFWKTKCPNSSPELTYRLNFRVEQAEEIPCCFGKGSVVQNAKDFNFQSAANKFLHSMQNKLNDKALQSKNTAITQKVAISSKSPASVLDQKSSIISTSETCSSAEFRIQASTPGILPSSCTEAQQKAESIVNYKPMSPSFALKCEGSKNDVSYQRKTSPNYCVSPQQTVSEHKESPQKRSPNYNKSPQKKISKYKDSFQTYSTPVEPEKAPFSQGNTLKNNQMVILPLSDKELSPILSVRSEKISESSGKNEILSTHNLKNNPQQSVHTVSATKQLAQCVKETEYSVARQKSEDKSKPSSTNLSSEAKTKMEQKLASFNKKLNISRLTSLRSPSPQIVKSSKLLQRYKKPAVNKFFKNVENISICLQKNALSRTIIFNPETNSSNRDSQFNSSSFTGFNNSTLSQESVALNSESSSLPTSKIRSSNALDLKSSLNKIQSLEKGGKISSNTSTSLPRHNSPGIIIRNEGVKVNSSMSGSEKQSGSSLKIKLNQSKYSKPSFESGFQACTTNEFSKIVNFLKTKILQKCKHLNQEQVQKQATDLARKFIRDSLVQTKFDKTTMKLLSDFANQHIK